MTMEDDGLGNPEVPGQWHCWRDGYIRCYHMLVGAIRSALESIKNERPMMGGKQWGGLGGKAGTEGLSASGIIRFILQPTPIYPDMQRESKQVLM